MSKKTALWTVLGSNITSTMVEYFAIAQVYHAVPELARPARSLKPFNQSIEAMDIVEESSPKVASAIRWTPVWFQKVLTPWSYYLRNSVFLASLSLSMLYLTVLSFNAQMVTYLLASGFTALWVALFRLVSVIVELGATWAAPSLMSRMGPIRSGLWFITWEFGCAAAGVAVFSMTALNQQLSTIALVVGVILSRVGLWGFDLSVQYLVQEASTAAGPTPIHLLMVQFNSQAVPPSHRSQFSTTEAALQNLFEMFSFATTSIFSHPDQFIYPALISIGAIGAANLYFTAFVRKERGHLFHRPRCLTVQKYQQVLEADED